MSDIKKHLQSDIQAPAGAKIGIVVSEYNPEITLTLLETCQNELVKRGSEKNDIDIIKVPGAFELPHGCKTLADTKKYDAIIALGCLIKGETPHFDFIAFAVSKGIMDLNLTLDIPVVFGLLTTNNIQQAEARIKDGKRGDKGVEAALTALKMIHLK
ncbi:6,7-dimethyl-8-ribityllumazine synthase [Candidatus Pacearchaeota archaeon]|nr:6,7-dimethyl-8-ribityllumazine synthase [Candidatus Pacearchaeota archaeon]